MPTGGIRTRTSGIMVPAFVAPTAAAFQGAGDIVGSAYAWWGVRAYTAASIGVRDVIDIRYLDTTVITYRAIAGGGLDTTQIAADTVTHGAPAEVSQLYDQTGNGRHLTAVTRPIFTISGSGITGPSINFTVAGAQNLTNTSFGTSAQPLTYGVVARHNTTAGQTNVLITAIAANAIVCGIYRATSDNTVEAGFAGASAPDIALTDGTWASVQCTFNNSVNDRQGVNSTQQTGTNLGTNTLDTTVIISQGGFALEGYVTEAGIWQVEFTGTQMTNMYNNQKAYYGLP